MPREIPVKLQVWRVGLLRYDRALALQHYVLEDRLLGHDDVLISLQHPPSITLGRRKLSHSVLTPHSDLRRLGIDIFHTDRQGDTTIHLPGQPILYPVISLGHLHMGLRSFMDLLGDVMINVARSYGVAASKAEFEGGCWIDQQRQLGAVGLRVTGGVTTHGLAFNAKPDLSYYSHIVPCCGIAGKEATSLARELGSAEGVDEGVVTEQLIESFIDAMGYSKVANRTFDMEKLVPAVDRLTLDRHGGRGWLLKLKELEANNPSKMLGK